MKKRFVAVLGIVSLLLCACGEQKVAEEPSDLNLSSNDWYGACNRIHTVKEDVEGVLNEYNARTDEIREKYPDSYWESEDYIFFSTNVVDESALEHTYYFNEEQADWETTVQFNSDSFEGVTTWESPVYIRKAKNSYSYDIRMDDNVVWNENASTKMLKRHVDCTYDASHDWLQALQYDTPVNNNLAVLDEFVEYAHLDNAVAIQTQNERLYVTYGDFYEEQMLPVLKTRTYVDEKGKEKTEQYVEEMQYEVLLGRKVKDIYYSKLSGKNRSCYPTEWSKEQRDEGAWTSVSEIEGVTYEGDVITQYGLNDTLFTKADSISKDWVFDTADTYSQQLEYHRMDDYMRVTYLNTMSNKLETLLFEKDNISKTEEVLIEEPVEEIEETESEEETDE